MKVRINLNVELEDESESDHDNLDGLIQKVHWHISSIMGSVLFEGGVCTGGRARYSWTLLECPEDRIPKEPDEFEKDWDGSKSRKKRKG